MMLTIALCLRQQGQEAGSSDKYHSNVADLYYKELKRFAKNNHHFLPISG